MSTNKNESKSESFKSQSSDEQAKLVGEAAGAPAESSDTGAADQSDEALDLDALDLSVETVEERISPSETNVFDK